MMDLEITVPMDDPRALARLVVHLPSVVLSASQVATAFGIALGVVLDDIAAGRLPARKGLKSWSVTARDAAQLYVVRPMRQDPAINQITEGV